jgi:hypothetical protein
MIEKFRVLIVTVNEKGVEEFYDYQCENLKVVSRIISNFKPKRRFKVQHISVDVDYTLV